MFNDTVQRKVYKLATSALFNFDLFFCCFRFCLRSAVYSLTRRQTGRAYLPYLFMFLSSFQQSNACQN